MSFVGSVVAGVLKWALEKAFLIGVGYRKATADQDRASLEAAQETNDDRVDVAPLSGDDLNDELHKTLK